MMDILKSVRSYSVIFSDIIVPTSTIEETLQLILITLQKEEVFRKNILGIKKRVLASIIRNIRRNTLSYFIQDDFLANIFLATLV